MSEFLFLVVHFINLMFFYIMLFFSSFSCSHSARQSNMFPFIMHIISWLCNCEWGNYFFFQFSVLFVNCLRSCNHNSSGSFSMSKVPPKHNGSVLRLCIVIALNTNILTFPKTVFHTLQNCKSFAPRFWTTFSGLAEYSAVIYSLAKSITLHFPVTQASNIFEETIGQSL